MRERWVLLIVVAAASLCGGCGGPRFTEKAKVGVTFYVPGAGNVDFGDAGLREGLTAAGYRGDVAAYMWTISFNPAIDQTLRLNARLHARNLAKIIRRYMDEYPGRPVHLVGLSAGSGIAVWALENLPEPYQVESVVLLGSSLWHRYDVGKALKRVKGKMYVYYSQYDAILAGPMKVFGTIDGVFGQDGAGSVGLHSPTGRDRIVNIPWKPEYESFGYHGGHVDATSAEFVRAYLSKHILSAYVPQDGGISLASPPEPPPRDEHQD